MDQTVYDNVALPLIIAGEHPKDVTRRVRAALDKVGLLEREKYRPIQLSGVSSSASASPGRWLRNQPYY